LKILLDESLPEQLAKELGEHEVITVSQMGWKGKKNGELIQLIQKEEFKAFITVDKNLRYQQNLKNLPFTIIVLFVYRTKMEYILKFLPEIKTALKDLDKNGILEIQ
jgi:predicted nuclease of predicted toxin-antitoxin system